MPRLRKNFFTKSRIIVAISIILILFFTLGLIREMVNRNKIDGQISKFKKEIKDLEEENNKINRLITTWSESNQLEKEARLKLNLQKQGEKAVLILREDDISVENELIPPEEKKSNILKWWIYFFGH